MYNKTICTYAIVKKDQRIVSPKQFFCNHLHILLRSSYTALMCKARLELLDHWHQTDVEGDTCTLSEKGFDQAIEVIIT